MARYRLIVAYLGQAYCGWQRQPGAPTVQGTLEQALARMTRGAVTDVIGASRTDAGVHAEGQVVVFDYDGRLLPREFLRGLNALTPDDITVRTIEAVDAAYHPRFDSRGKRYRYLIFTGKPCPPTLRGRVWWLRKGRVLDLEAMREAAAHLVGEHDFAAFRASDCEARSSVRRIYQVNVTGLGGGYLEPRTGETGLLVAIDVCGNAFLKYMVRVIAGTLAQVGQGHRAPGSLAEALAQRERTLAGITAPLDGLTLVRVYLPGDTDIPGAPLTG